MYSFPLEFDISSTNTELPLGVRVVIDNVTIYDNARVTESYHFCHNIADIDGEHELAIELYNKLPIHTEINSSGEIVQDALITIENIQFDGIEVSPISTINLFTYHHDFNGTQAPVADKFYGVLGCNGQVKMKFATPIYLWLLENM